jgi:hypothetical protein
VRWWELGIRISDRRDTDTDDDLHLETSTYRTRRSAERSRAGTCRILTLRLHVSGSEFLLSRKMDGTVSMVRAATDGLAGVLKARVSAG